MITWYKGTRIVSAGKLKILKDPRLELINTRNGINLFIRNVNMDDEDDYSCEVNLKDRDPVQIKHKLKVLGKELHLHEDG